MNELSLFLLDIIQNSIAAHATEIKLEINEEKKKNLLTIKIIDNGIGIKSDNIADLNNPFYTTRKTRRIGLGIPLFKEICELSQGSLSISSTYGKGTTVFATMEHDHLDRLPIGNMSETIYSLLINDQDIDIEYIHFINEKKFELRSKEINTILDGISLQQYDVMIWIKEYITKGLKTLEEES